MTFSENVTGVDPSDFQVVATGGATALPIVSVAPQSGSVYGVSVTGVTGPGSVRLDLVNNRSIHDSAGQTLIGTNDTVHFAPAENIPLTGDSNVGRPLATGDFNSDGFTDFLVGTSNGDSADIYLGDGAGGFVAPIPLTASPASSVNTFGIVAADVNGDGKLDLIVPENSQFLVFRGLGTGQFAAPVTFATGANNSAPVIADFNHDGLPDVAVAGSADGKVRIFPGNSATLLASPTIVAAGTVPSLIATGDFNGDGKPDFVVNDATNSVHVFFGDGHGNFVAGPSPTIEVQANSLSAVDINADGFSDIVTTGDLFGSGSIVDVLAGSSTGAFAPFVSSRILQTDAPLVTADLNGDGLPDLIQSNGLGFSILTNVGGETFKSTQDLQSVELADGIATADFNHDGVADVLLTSDESPNATVLLGQGASFVGQTYTILPPVRVNSIDRETPVASTTSAGSVTYHVQFSTAVKNIDAADFNVVTTGTVKAGTIALSASQGSAVDVTVNGVHGNGTLQLSLIDNNTITDLSGNPLGAAQPRGGSFVGQTYTISQTEPRVIGINREAPLSPTIGDQPVTYQVLFNEAVTGVDASDFQVMTTGDVGYSTPLIVAGNSQVYTVTVNGLTGGGSLTLKLKDNGSIHDLRGNRLASGDDEPSFDAATVSQIPGPVLEVSTADFTGDGLADRISITSNSIYVEPGNGDGTFGAPIRTFSSFPLTAFVIDDFNHDGKLDVAAVGTAGVYLFPGLGNGKFGAPIISATGVSTPVALQAADFNADGSTDLLVTTDFQGDVILLADGHGRFTFNGTYIYAGAVVTVGDFNNDGFPDIQGTGNFQNDGQGNFSPADTTSIATSTPKYPTSATTALADLNGDGIADTVTVNGEAFSVDVSFGKSDGSMGPTTSYDVGSSASQIVLTDVNNDGHPDITAVVPNGVTTLLNKGDGTFSTPETITPGFQTSALHVTTADFNHDGRADLIVSGAQQSDADGIDFVGVIQVYLANPDGTYSPAGVVSTGGAEVTSVTVADINGDGIPDLIGSEFNVNTLLICLGTADGQLIAQTSDGIIASGVAVADFNGDGRPDIVTSNGPAGPEIRDGNGDGTFGAPVPLTNLPGGNNVSVADLNGDGKPDLVFDGSSVDVAIGNGNNTFQPAKHIIATASPYILQAKTADMNQDGIADLIVADSATPNDVSIYLGNGDGTFAPQRTFFTGDTTSFDVGDVNGDGIPDVITSKDATFVALGNGDGTLTPSVQYAPAGYITIGDANGDGRADVIFAHHARYNSGGSLTGNLSGIGVIFGNATGDFVGDTYRIIRTSDVISGSSGIDSITLTQDPDHIHIDWQNGSDSGQMAINDLAGLTVFGNGGIDQINLNYAYGDPLPLKTTLNGQFDLNNLQTADNLAGRTIEIGGSRVWVTYSGAATDPVSALRNYLYAGFNNRTWTGAGSTVGGAIISSTAAHDPTHTGIGYSDSANAVLLQSSLYGDSNLDGIVDASDAAVVNQHQGKTNATWSDGDFNYDGLVDAADVALLSANYVQSTPTPIVIPSRPARVPVLPPPPASALNETPTAPTSDPAPTKSSKTIKPAKELKIEVKAVKKAAKIAAKVDAKKKH